MLLGVTFKWKQVTKNIFTQGIMLKGLFLV